VSDTGETIILCRSAERRSKEQATHEKIDSAQVGLGVE
jgi:hypothetical protein